MGHLMDCVGVVCSILVLDLGKQVWELLVLVQGATCVEPWVSDRQNLWLTRPRIVGCL